MIPCSFCEALGENVLHVWKTPILEAKEPISVSS